MRRPLSLLALSVLVACSAADEPDRSERLASHPDALKVCPKAKTPGLDVSKWQGSVSWTKVKASGRKFAFIRVSDGVNTPDSLFATNWTNARKAGVIRGAYQFFRPTQDPVAQAKLLLKKMGKLQDGDLPPVIDVEVADGVSGATIASKVKKWLTTVQNATGKKPIIYTASGFWSSIGNPSGFTTYPLWVANWGVSCPNLPGAWKEFAFWQYSDKGSVSGVSGGVDVNYFNGSLAQLQAFGVADKDGDGIADTKDSCPSIDNPDQSDIDKDGQGNACDTDDDADKVADSKDNCPTVKNADQKNTDKDKQGDACDADDDNDGVIDTKDNCPLVSNKAQTDTDKDKKGDACDDDDDGDGVADATDNCPTVKNADQKDSDGDKKGDACETDDDGDGVPDATDNCPAVKNADQDDADGDQKGDACDDDLDGDGFKNAVDTCPDAADPDQKDTDKDKQGDACDTDDDGDGIADDDDTCPLVANPDQKDWDEDGQGDVCDPDLDSDTVPNDQDNCPDDPNTDQLDTDQDGQGDACEPDVIEPEPPDGDGGSGGASGQAGKSGGAGQAAPVEEEAAPGTESSGGCAQGASEPGAWGPGVAALLGLLSLRRRRTPPRAGRS